jgi:Bacterial regulatory protein, arsR family
MYSRYIITRGVILSGSEEETYSIMFSSLKHPARRKILRMLSERSLTFSQMLEELTIPSSHLTYHLENLGDLVIKEENGKYKLSSFGKASVSMMKGAEEVPDVHAQKFSTLPLRWKSVFVIFAVAIVFLAGMTAVQYAGINQLSVSNTRLQQDYDKIKAQNDQLLSWSNSANQAMVMLKDVIQLDTSKYQSSLVGTPVAEVRNDLGGVVQEVTEYSFVSSVSRLEVTLRFRNNEFSLYKLDQIEGAPNFPPVYTASQPTDDIQAAKELLQRYQTATNDSYLQDMITLLSSANANTTQAVLDNTKLIISNSDGTSDITLQYTASGVDFVGKTLSIGIQNHILTDFQDSWSLYTIGDDHLNITADQAIQIAKNAVKGFTWNAGGEQVSNFTVLDNPASAEFYPHTRPDNSVVLYPYWYVTLHLDKTYPGNVNVIAVGVWADTGEVANKQALAGAT